MLDSFACNSYGDVSPLRIRQDLRGGHKDVGVVERPMTQAVVFSSFSFTQRQGIYLTTVGTGYAPHWMLNDFVGYTLFGDMHNQAQGVVAQKLLQERQ